MNIPDSLRDEVRRLAADCQKIEAVKRIKATLNLSLKESVEVFDLIQQGQPPMPLDDNEEDLGEPAPMPTSPAVPSASASAASSPHSRTAHLHRRLASGPGGSDAVVRTIFSIFFILGIIMAGLAFYLVQKERDFRKTAERVPAIIVDSQQAGSHYRPIYEYKWRGEVRRTSGALDGSTRSRQPFEPGTKQTLIISRKDPTQMHVDNFVGAWIWPTIVGGIAGVFLFMGTVGWFVTRR